MILAPEQGRLRVVTQPDHARFAADLLRLWREPELVDHPRRQALLDAVREHDNGWREADAAPRVDPGSARPYSFLDLPVGPRLEVWRRGVARFREARPYVALMVAEHFLRLHRDRRGEPAWEETMAAVEAERDELLEETALDREDLDGDYAWLDLADFLSLAVCNGWNEPFRRRGRSGHLAAGALHLDPFPLAGSTTFALSCRRVPDRRYRSDGDFAVELASARWGEDRIRVLPAPAA